MKRVISAPGSGGCTANQLWFPSVQKKLEKHLIEPRYLHQQLQYEYHEFYNQGHFGGDCDNRTFPEPPSAFLHNLRIEPSHP